MYPDANRLRAWLSLALAPVIAAIVVLIWWRGAALLESARFYEALMAMLVGAFCTALGAWSVRR